MTKEFLLKVYTQKVATPANTFIYSTNQFAFSTITNNINSGYGTLTITLPKKFDDFDEGTIIKFNNQVKIYAYDDENPEGIVKYSGYITSIKANVGETESVTIECAGYQSMLSLDIARDGFGNYNLSSGAVDWYVAFQLWYDAYMLYNPTSPFIYNKPADLGYNVEWSSKSSTWQQAIDYIYKQGNASWYYYFDANCELFVKPVASTAKHIFTFGKDIYSVNFDKNISEIKNEVLFWNGVTGGGSIAKKYTDATSVTNYGRRVELKQDGRVTSTTTADAIGNRFIADNKDVFDVVTIQVLDNGFSDMGYDTDSIQVGDTFLIRNINANNSLSKNMLITNITDNIDYVEIVAEDVTKTTSRVLYNLQEQLRQLQTQNAPNAYV